MDIVWLTYVSTYFMLDLSKDVDAHQQKLRLFTWIDTWDQQT